MKKPYLNLRIELYKLNWIKILNDAINDRKTSWSERPVREWRNAGDTVCFALIHALEDKGLIETIFERIEKIKKAYEKKHKNQK